MQDNKYNSILSLGLGQVNYGTFPVVTIDKFEVFPSTITIIEGANGSGKTSFFRSIAGIRAHFTGDIKFCDRLLINTPAHKRVRTGIKFVPQDRCVFDRLTFKQHLMLSSKSSWGPQAKSHIDNIIDSQETMALFGNVNKYGLSLSGGQAKIMLLLCVAQGMPKLLMLDEPYAGLADAGRSIVNRVVEMCVDSGGTCLISDHTERAIVHFQEKRIFKLVINKDEINTEKVPYRMVPFSEGV